jgi:2-isopropylmalate synthase
MFCALADEYGAQRFAFEYSPESFSQTEPAFALDICNAILTIWEGRPGNIINLPATVEVSTPNVHADQIEYMCRHLKNRSETIVSVHTHNDRGTAVAAAELGLLAGADRVEGTLFGNGERTGNADLITLALNLYSQGIETGLDFSNIDKMIAVYEKIIGLPVHPRHPYAGELVYTAFSGTHQDAIRKALLHQSPQADDPWQIPYLPIDPQDVGRSRDHVIRFNSQSGKGGAAFILRQHFDIEIPKRMQHHFGAVVIRASDTLQKELSPEEMHRLFKETYEKTAPLELIQYKEEQSGEDIILEALMHINGEPRRIHSEGNGPVDAFCNALCEHLGRSFEVMDYRQHTMGKQGKKSQAISYVQIMAQDKIYFGTGISKSVSTSSLRAVVSAVNQVL